MKTKKKLKGPASFWPRMFSKLKNCPEKKRKLHRASCWVAEACESLVSKPWHCHNHWALHWLWQCPETKWPVPVATSLQWQTHPPRHLSELPWNRKELKMHLAQSLHQMHLSKNEQKQNHIKITCYIRLMYPSFFNWIFLLFHFAKKHLLEAPLFLHLPTTSPPVATWRSFRRHSPQRCTSPHPLLATADTADTEPSPRHPTSHRPSPQHWDPQDLHCDHCVWNDLNDLWNGKETLPTAIGTLDHRHWWRSCTWWHRDEDVVSAAIPTTTRRSTIAAIFHTHLWPSCKKFGLPVPILSSWVSRRKTLGSWGQADYLLLILVYP